MSHSPLHYSKGRIRALNSPALSTVTEESLISDKLQQERLNINSKLCLITSIFIFINCFLYFNHNGLYK